jgi:hypothetical protein
VRDGDHYIVDGQKTWTSFAHWADWIFCLVRTDPGAKPQQGISFLLIDMKTPGVTVRPIVMLDGAHHVNDVFLDNVRVPGRQPASAGRTTGWTCAKFLLANERLGIAEVPAPSAACAPLWQLNDDPALKEKIADVDLQVQALEMSELRALSTLQLGGAPGPEASILKVRGSEIQQRIAELADGGGRRVRGALAARTCCSATPTRRRSARPCAARRAALSQHAQDHDLRRQHRDPEEHRVESDPRTVAPWQPERRACGLGMTRRRGTLYKERKTAEEARWT